MFYNSFRLSTIIDLEKYAEDALTEMSTWFVVNVFFTIVFAESYRLGLHHNLDCQILISNDFLQTQN